MGFIEQVDKELLKKAQKDVGDYFEDVVTVDQAMDKVKELLAYLQVERYELHQTRLEMEKCLELIDDALMPMLQRHENMDKVFQDTLEMSAAMSTEAREINKKGLSVINQCVGYLNTLEEKIVKATGLEKKSGFWSKLLFGK